MIFADSVFWKNSGNAAYIIDRADVTFSSTTIVGSSSVFENISVPEYDIISHGTMATASCGTAACSTRHTTVQYSLVQGGFSGMGNLNTDPMFVDLDHGDFWGCNRDRRLVDSGSLDLQKADETDLDQDGDKTEAMPFDFDADARLVGA